MAAVRILFVNHVGSGGGAERTLADLIGALPRLDFSLELLLACPEGGWLSEAAREAGAEVVTVPQWRPRWRNPRAVGRSLADAASFSRALAGIIEEHRPDILHANSLAAALAAPRGAAPLVWQARDLRAPGPAVSLAAARADAIAAISQCVARFVARWQPAARGKMHVIYNGVDVGRLCPTGTSAELRARLGLAPHRPCVGAAAQFVPWKRLDIFIRAAAWIAARRPDVQFAIAGADVFGEHASHAAYLRQLAGRLGLGQRLAFVGWVERPVDFLAALDVYLHPTPCEPLGRVIIEAMALSVPVVAVDRCGPAELIVHGETGLLGPPQPAALGRLALRLLDAPALARAMGEKARRFAAASLSAEAMARSYLEQIYRPLASRQGE